MVAPLEIGGRRLGGNAPCFVIAEARVNHNGRQDLALMGATNEIGQDLLDYATK